MSAVRLSRAEIHRAMRSFGYRGRKSKRNKVTKQRAEGLVAIECEMSDDSE